MSIIHHAHKFKISATHYMVECIGKVIMIDNTPCRKCQICGLTLYTEHVMKRIFEIGEEIFNDNRLYINSKYTDENGETVVFSVYRE